MDSMYPIGAKCCDEDGGVVDCFSVHALDVDPITPKAYEYHIMSS